MTTTSSRGILMQGDRVRAILEDRKSQTRRLRGLTKLNSGPYKDRINKVECRDGVWCFWGIWGSSALPVFHAKCPYGVPVDLLYLKEAHRHICDVKGVSCVQYRADNSALHAWALDNGEGDFCRVKGKAKSIESTAPWTPSIFMPRWASRITLEITEVRVERVQDISEKDAIAEGINCQEPFKVPYRCQYVATEQLRYSFIWDSINGKNFPWIANPWVWAISFRRVK